jgi:hypothetical protein
VVLAAAANAADDYTTLPAGPRIAGYQACTHSQDPTHLTQFPPLGDTEASQVTAQPGFLRQTGRSVSNVHQTNRDGETASQACCRNWCGWLILACYYCRVLVLRDDQSGD